MNLKTATITTLLCAAGLSWGTAHAGPVTCPLDPVATRVFVLTTAVDSTCLASGDGNLQGQVGSDDAFTSSAAGAGYTALDKDPGDALPGIENLFSVAGLGSASGSFTIDASLWTLYDSLAIGFNVGHNLSPDWAVFSLASGTLTGTWSNAPRQGAALSHANIYGIARVTAVPEPASLALMGLALLGLGIARRSAKATTAV